MNSESQRLQEGRAPETPLKPYSSWTPNALLALNLRPPTRLKPVSFLPRDVVDELDRDAEAIPDKTGHGRLAGRESEHPKDSRNERPPSVVHSGKEECHDAQPP